MRWPPSVRIRLTLWYTVVLTVPLAAFAIVSYLIFSGTLRNRTDAFLGDAVSVFAAELAVERGRTATLEDAVRTTVAELRFRYLDIVVLDADTVIGMSTTDPVRAGTPGDANTGVRVLLPEISTLAQSDPAAPSAAPRLATLQRAGAAFRVRVQPLAIGDRTLQLAGVYPLVEVDETLEAIRRLFLITIPLLIAVAAAGGSFLARRSLRPVTQMAARAADIGANTLHERLPVVTEDEVGTLGRVLNDLLDRLEGAFAQQRRFMADASHELRTPTAIVRAEADVTLSREPRTETEYRASMEIVQDAARRLTRIVDDIFLLARADAGHVVTHPGPLYIEDVLRDTVLAIRPIADARGVRIALHDVVEGPLFGDADLLGRLVLNLLDNAIKHSPEGETIDIVMVDNSDRFELSVVDRGPGVPDEARERIFQRFYRVDTARSRQERTMTSGAGLGLSIGRRIAEMHGGSLTLVSSAPGRTEFRVSLPSESALARPAGTLARPS